LRLLGMGPPKTMNEFDAALGWSKTPGEVFGRSTREFDVTFDINELGLRDDPMSNPGKPANTFRVLALGDSFTLGFTVAREDLFVDQLERWWQAENRRVDVINAGTEGYSTDQAVAWLMEHGPKFEPDLVMLFPYDNDLYWNGQAEYMGKQKPRFTPEGQLEERTLEDTSDKSWRSCFALTRLLGPKPDIQHHFLKEHGAVLLNTPDFMTDALARTAGALKAMKTTCDELGARGVVVPIPSTSVVDTDYAEKFGPGALGLSADRWSPSKPVDTVLAMARDAGLDTLDPRTTLKATATGQDLYFKYDWHFNEAGNKAFAMFLHDELDHIGAFPAGHQAPAGAPVGLPDVVSEGQGAPFWLRLYVGLWAGLTTLYLFTYKDEPKWQPPFKVALLLSAVFAIVMGGNALVGLLPPQIGQLVMILAVLTILGFVAFKIGRRLGTIAELMKSFVLRGHWYLMPLIVVLLTIGSLLVVAASSPLVAPFIYTLF
jgi:hypothetical protein